MARTNRGDAGQAATGNDGTGGPVPESFTSLLAGCRFSAVHLEQREVYTPDNPDYLRWRDGDHFDFAGDGSSLRQPENRGEPAVVSLCLAAFEAVWERAIPHEDCKPA